MKVGDIVKIIRAESKEEEVDVGRLCRLMDIRKDEIWNLFWYHVEPLGGESLYCGCYIRDSLEAVPEGKLTKALYY